MSVPLAILLLVLLGLLALVSYVDRLYAEMGKFLSREFQENIEAYEERVEPRLHVSRERAAMSMTVLTQLSMASIGVLIGYELFMEKRWVGLDLVQAAVSLIFIIVIFHQLIPHLFFVRTKGEWLVHWAPVLRGLIYLAMPATLILGFGLSVASLTREHAEKAPEHPSEAVDALIEAGQEEGILEESDRALIQSVVEFGNKTVREVIDQRSHERQSFALLMTTPLSSPSDDLRIAARLASDRVDVDADRRTPRSSRPRCRPHRRSAFRSRNTRSPTASPSCSRKTTRRRPSPSK